MTPVPNDRVQRTYRVRIALFLIGAVLLVLLLSYLYEGIQTLNALEQIESDRDRWQRPSDVIQALNLHQGSVVVEFGCGVGYFALKLCPLVGKNGVRLKRRTFASNRWFSFGLERSYETSTISRLFAE